MRHNTIIINGKRYSDDDQEPEDEKEKKVHNFLDGIFGLLVIGVLASAGIWMIIKIWRSILG